MTANPVLGKVLRGRKTNTQMIPFNWQLWRSTGEQDNTYEGEELADKEAGKVITEPQLEESRYEFEPKFCHSLSFDISQII